MGQQKFLPAENPRRMEIIKLLLLKSNSWDTSNYTININYPNPLLKSLVSKFEPSLKNNLATLVSNTEKKEKNNWILEMS